MRFSSCDQLVFQVPFLICPTLRLLYFLFSETDADENGGGFEATKSVELNLAFKHHKKVYSIFF